MRIVRAVMWCKRQLRYFELAVAASKSLIKITKVLYLKVK